jgi:putative oxidoreductase
LFNLERTVNKLNQARFKELAYIFGNLKSVIASGIPMLIAGIALMLVLNQNMPP